MHVAGRTHVYTPTCQSLLEGVIHLIATRITRRGNTAVGLSAPYAAGDRLGHKLLLRTNSNKKLENTPLPADMGLTQAEIARKGERRCLS